MRVDLTTWALVGCAGVVLAQSINANAPDTSRPGATPPAPKDCHVTCWNNMLDKFSDFKCDYREHFQCLCVNNDWNQGIEDCGEDHCGTGSTQYFDLMGLRRNNCAGHIHDRPNGEDNNKTSRPSFWPPGVSKDSSSSAASNATERDSGDDDKNKDSKEEKEDEEDEDNELPTGAKIGIAVGGGAIAVLLLALVIALCMRRRDRARPARNEKGMDISSPMPGSGRSFATDELGDGGPGNTGVKNDLELSSTRYENMIPRTQPSLNRLHD